MNNATSLSSLIWSSADDILRGLFKPSEYGRVILPFVVMRRLDCVLEPKKDEVYDLFTEYKDKVSDPYPVIIRQTGLRFCNTSKYDLSRIKSDPTNVLMNFKNYIQGYSNNVLDIIDNFQIHPLVEKLHKQKRLYLLIDKFTEFDLHPNKIDNHQMGLIYEEILRKFSEMSNEESGDHFTPRDVVELLVSFVFGGDTEDLQGEGKIRSVFDPCCGTGGMLTIGKEWVHKNINRNLRVDLYGQELNDVTYSICKSDLLMMDENPENIQGPASSISDDHYQGRKFEYMITNPPFGVSWKSEKEFVDEESKDPRGRFFVGTPRISDGSLLFLQHLIHKMAPKGARIGIVFNGSPLFTGDAGSGESEIRKWIIENDWLECIVQLPDQMFFNTGITTYFWIVTNKKSPERKGKVQLINGSSFHKIMKKSLGSKRKEIIPEQSNQLFQIYKDFEEGEFSKISPNNFFGYTKVVIEQPLIEDGKSKTDKKGKLKLDSSKRDNERVPLSEDIDEYYNREVKPYLPDSWMDRSKDKIGYEIKFVKYFYKFTPLRSLEEIAEDLTLLERDIKELTREGTQPLHTMVEYPLYWESQKLKYLFTYSLSSVDRHQYDDEKSMNVCHYPDVYHNEKIESVKNLPTGTCSEEEFQKFKIYPGDILITKDSESRDIGVPCFISDSLIDTVCGYHLGIIRPRDELDSGYFFRFLQTQVVREYFYGECSGITRFSLGKPSVENLTLPVPPPEEQKRISFYLDKKTEQIDSLIQKIQRKIELLKEYRQSLISSVATGKVRITEDMI